MKKYAEPVDKPIRLSHTEYMKNETCEYCGVSFVFGTKDSVTVQEVWCGEILVDHYCGEECYQKVEHHLQKEQDEMEETYNSMRGRDV